jgi:hypothetical protein
MINISGQLKKHFPYVLKICSPTKFLIKMLPTYPLPIFNYSDPAYHTLEDCLASYFWRECEKSLSQTLNTSYLKNYNFLMTKNFKTIKNNGGARTIKPEQEPSDICAVIERNLAKYL